MEKRFKLFLIALAPILLIFVLVFFLKIGLVNGQMVVSAEKAGIQFFNDKGVIEPEMILNLSTEYPIETTGTPGVSSTFRPTSTPWPSRTPTPTPPYYYRATNTIAGVTPPTTTPLPEKTRNALSTITAFYTTQTARFSTEQPTEAPTETLALTFTNTATPDGTEDLPGKEHETDTGETEFTPTALHVSVQTEKTNRYQEKIKSLNWLFYGLLLGMLGFGVFLYTRKSNTKPPSNL